MYFKVSVHIWKVVRISMIRTYRSNSGLKNIFMKGFDHSRHHPFGEGKLVNEIMRLNAPFANERRSRRESISGFTIFAMILTASYFIQGSFLRRAGHNPSLDKYTLESDFRDQKVDRKSCEERRRGFRESLRTAVAVFKRKDTDDSDSQPFSYQRIQEIIVDVCNGVKRPVADLTYDDQDILKILQMVTIAPYRSISSQIKVLWEAASHWNREYLEGTYSYEHKVVIPAVPYVPESWESRRQRARHLRSEAKSGAGKKLTTDMKVSGAELSHFIDSLDSSHHRFSLFGYMMRTKMKRAQLTPSQAQKIALEASSIVFKRMLQGLNHLKTELGLVPRRSSAKGLPWECDIHSPIHNHYNYRNGKVSQQLRYHMIVPEVSPFLMCWDCLDHNILGEVFIRGAIELHRYIWLTPDGSYSAPL